MDLELFSIVISYFDINTEKSIGEEVCLIFKLTKAEKRKLFDRWLNLSNLSYKTDEFKNKFCYVNGILHRDDGLPAASGPNGAFWYVHNKLHRDGDLPAVVWITGYINSYDRDEWWVDGKRHRDNDKPAIEFRNGKKEWWVDGKRHRDNDKPAVIYSNGKKEWWRNNIRYEPDHDSLIKRCINGILVYFSQI